MTQKLGSIHWRQLDIADPEQLKTPVTVVGAGGIGSEVVKILAKVGFSNIEVYDDDSVEDYNLPNQFYRTQDVGKPKVLALKEIIKDFTDLDIEAHETKFISQRPNDILIVTVDSMDTRIAIYKQVRYQPNLKYLIDGRMGGEIFCVYTVDMSNPMEKEHYEKSLYPSSEAEEAPCTAKAILYNVGTVASMIVNNAKRACMKQNFRKQIDFDYVNMMLYTI